MEAGGSSEVFLKLGALVVDVVIAGILVVFGVFARKRQSWAFITGMILFAADGLLFLLVQGWLSLAFHGFVLYCLYGGLKAARMLDGIDLAVEAAEALSGAAVTPSHPTDDLHSDALEQ